MPYKKRMLPGFVPIKNLTINGYTRNFADTCRFRPGRGILLLFRILTE